MAGWFSSVKEKIMGPDYSEVEKEGSEYVELDTEASEAQSKVIIHPYNLEDFDDVKPILDSLREGKTIALVNIKPLKEKDVVELKRAINKLKKTCDAINGEIAGFGEDYIVVAPPFATIHRVKEMTKVEAEE